MAALFNDHDNSNFDGIRNLKELLTFAHKSGYDVDFSKKRIDLDFYQKEIDLIAFAEDCPDLEFNYKILKEKSSNRSYSLRPDPEKGGNGKFDRIVVSQNSRGMYKYWNLDVKEDKGTIIDFIQNRLELPKNDFKTPIHICQKFSFGNHEFNKKHKIVSSNFNVNSAVNVSFKPRKLEDFSYLNSRGISKDTILSSPFLHNIFQSSVNNIGQATNKTFTLFPIKTKFGGFSSFIFKGEGVSKKEAILKDSARSVGLWISNIKYDVDEKDINVLEFKTPAAELKYSEDFIDYVNDAYQNKMIDLDFYNQKISVINDSFSEDIEFLNKGIEAGDLVIAGKKSITRTPQPVDNLYLSEAPIDCLSYHELYNRDSKENNVYIGTAGSISPTQYQLINETISRLKPKTISPIFDNDSAGRKYNMAFLSNLNMPEFFHSANDPLQYQNDFDTISKSLHSLTFTPNYVEKNNPTLIFSAFIDPQNLQELRSSIFDKFKTAFSELGLDVSEGFNYNFRDKNKMLHFYVKIPNNSKYWDAILDFYKSAKFNNSPILNIQHPFFKDYNRDLKIIKGLDPLKIGEINKLAVDNEYFLKFQNNFLPKLETDLSNSFDLPKSFSKVDLNSVSSKEFNRISVFQAILNGDDKPYSMDEIHREMSFNNSKGFSPNLNLPFEIDPVFVLDSDKLLQDRKIVNQQFLGKDGLVYTCVRNSDFNEFIAIDSKLDNPILGYSNPESQFIQINSDTVKYIYQFNPNLNVDNLLNDKFQLFDKDQLKCKVEFYRLDNSLEFDKEYKNFGQALHDVLINEHENVKFVMSKGIELSQDYDSSEFFGSSKEDDFFMNDDGEVNVEKIEELESYLSNFGNENEIDNEIELDIGMPKNPFSKNK